MLIFLPNIFISDGEGEEDLGEFLQDIDSLEGADNINEAITGYDARDEARICRFTKSDGTCFKGKNCKLEHKPLPEGRSSNKVCNEIKSCKLDKN